MTDDDQPSKAERRQRYERLLDIVARNVGDPQPPTCAARTLWQIVGESSLERDPMMSAVLAAVENDHLLRFADAAGRQRYALTTAGIEAAPHEAAPLFGPADVPALDDLIQREVDSADVNQQVIAWANQRKAAIADHKE